MKISQNLTTPLKKLIVKKCHMCGKIIESYVESKKCPKCKKSFLPLNYFQKSHDYVDTEYEEYFSKSEELTDEDLIKGIYVLW